MAEALAALDQVSAERDQLRGGQNTGSSPNADAVEALEASVAQLTMERDTARARVTELETQNRTLTSERDTLKANQATAEEIARHQFNKVGQPLPVGFDPTGGKKDPANMTLTERAKAAIEAKQGGVR